MYKDCKLDRKEIERIAMYYKMGSHTMERLNERYHGNFTVKEMILNCLFAYKNTDGVYRVCVDKQSYFVVNPETYFLISYVVKDEGRIDVYQLYEKACRGEKR